MSAREWLRDLAFGARLAFTGRRPWSRLAGRRSCRAGSGKNRTWTEDAPDIKTDGCIGGAVAADAWGRGASVVVVLQGDEEARRRDRRTDPPAVITLRQAHPALSA